MRYKINRFVLGDREEVGGGQGEDRECQEEIPPDLGQI